MSALETDPDALKPYISRAIEAALTRAEAEAAFDVIMSGRATPAQIGGFLMILRMRGESIEEISGAAAAMRAKALPVSAPEGAMDIVGTGGDGKGTLNISTAAALADRTLDPRGGYWLYERAEPSCGDALCYACAGRNGHADRVQYSGAFDESCGGETPTHGGLYQGVDPPDGRDTRCAGV